MKAIKTRITITTIFLAIFSLAIVKNSNAVNSPISLNSDNYGFSTASKSFFEADAICSAVSKRLPTIEEFLFFVSTRRGATPFQNLDDELLNNDSTTSWKCYWTTTQPDYYHMVGKIHLSDYTNNRLHFLMACIAPNDSNTPYGFTIIPATELGTDVDFSNLAGVAGGNFPADNVYERTLCVQAK